ncbi:MAG: carboxypeptidase regulatory-like domain-containing protein [Bacteroidales bacterium]|nr:carboxypeptidase regulatory-like domain-containing protein [Bacteroidales bacterium]
MKKKINTLTALLFFSLLPLTLFSSCDKDTNCYLDVLVVDEASRAPVSNVNVDIFQTNGTVNDNGITGNDGIYKTHFVAPAVLSIKVTLPLGDGTERRGDGTVRLKEGETVTSTITLGKQIF